MTTIITELARFIMILLIAVYTLQSFVVFKYKDEEQREQIYYYQIIEILFFHLIANLVIYLHTQNIFTLLFYLAQLAFMIAVYLTFQVLYPKCSRVLVNHMILLLLLGFTMLTRLDMNKSIKQFTIACCGMVLCAFIPWIIKKANFLRNWTWFYLVCGLGLLLAVTIIGSVTYGSKINFTIAGITFAPNEFVKIIFVFFVASFFTKASNFRATVTATILAAVHVLILVVSKDLGSALIYFMVYMSMLFVATRNYLYVGSGLMAFSGAAVVAYFLFNHVRVRVMTWTTPFDVLQNDTSQIAQSLFAVGTGGFFGSGLYHGLPETIPVAAADFIFSVICEELGTLFGICVILICLSCFIMFVNIALQMKDMFYRLVGLGLSVVFIFQVFLTIGGDIKFIPLTGVTLPLVSYGGSSILSSLAMFAIIQGLYVTKAVPAQERKSGGHDEKSKKRHTRTSDEED